MAGEKKKLRNNGEYKVTKTWQVHPDAVAAIDRMAERFKPSYGSAIKKKLVTFGVLLLEKEIKSKGVKPGEDIETVLGI